MRKKDSKFAKIALENRLMNLLDAVKATRQALKALERDDFVYEVTLDSLWADHGERSANGSGKSLSQAVKNAEAAFKTLNARSDVQASRSYAIKFPNGVEVYLPIDDQ